ncbi:MAG: hypothetical protein ABIF77_14340 [bacterium]
MSTFVVQFVEDPTGAFRGHVRHISSGEDTVFVAVDELLAFFEAMNAASGRGISGANILERGTTDDGTPQPSGHD